MHRRCSGRSRTCSLTPASTESPRTRAYVARAEVLGEARVGSLEPRRTLAEWIEELELATMSLEDRLRQRDADGAFSAALLERVRSPSDEAPVLVADELAALLRGLTSPTVPAHLRSLSTHDEIVSGVFAALAQQNLDRAVELVASLSPAPLLRVAAGVRLDQLAHVAALQATLGASVVRATFLAALRADRLAEVAACLAPAVHAGAPGASPVHALISACIRAQHKGEPVAELLRELGAPTAGSGDAQAGRLLAMIDKPPGMVGIYHRLRLLAQELFFRPLRDLIAARDVAAALTCWRGLGDREEMLTTCLYRLPNVAREINDNHVEQTRRYLRNFDEALADWERGGGGLQTRAGVREVVEAWDSLSESESREIRRALEGQEDPSLPAADFGRRFFEDTGGVLCVASEVAIPPELVSSWIRRCRGTAVPFAVYLADQVRLGEGTTIGDAVAEMLRRECYGAALRAAADDAGLLGAVRRQIEARRRDLEARYAGPLRAARALRAEDPPLEDYLDDLDILLNTLDFVQAEAWLAELADFLCERERERDPIRRGALDFLAELGPADEFRNEAREELLARVAEARERHADRRWQVLALQTLALGDLLAHLAEEIDRPRLWPTAPDLSAEIAAAIDGVLRYTQAQAQRYRDYDPDTVDRLTAAAGPWLAVVLRDGLPSREGVAPLLDLAADIHAFAPPRRVAELLSVGPAAAALSAGSAAERRSLAVAHYRRGDYRRCQELVADDPEAELIRRGAGVMEMLQRGSPLDIDWLALRGSLLALRRTSGLPSPLLARLDALDALAEVFVRNKDVPRIIDRLAAPGPRGYDPQDLRALLFALTLHLEVCRRKPPSEAFTLAMVLPEQIFRVWARWLLNLDMTCVPNGRQGVWQLVEEAWDLDGRGGRLRRATPGEPFPSFRCFALFVQLELLVRGRTGAVGVLERSVDDLQAALRVLRIRNDGAHALTRLSDQQHAQYFALITRWLEQLYLACPSIDGRRLRAEVDELLQPLPL